MAATRRKFLGLTLLTCGLGFLAMSPTALAASDTLAEIKQRKELRVGLDPGFIPFEMKKPNGDWVGFDIDMVHAWASELGVKATFLDTKWEGIIPSLVTKKFDVIVSGMTITDERSKAVLFSSAYYKAGLTALVSKKASEKIKTGKDLDSPSVTIAVKLGTTGDIFVKKSFTKAQTKQFDTEADAATAVRMGKVDAFIYDRPYVELFAKKNEGKVVALQTLLTEEDLGLAARKSDQALVDSFNGFLKRWKESGEYEKTKKKHFVDMPWVADFPELK
jgi:polar amino acid transport system substrate-binding protein